MKTVRDEGDRPPRGAHPQLRGTEKDVGGPASQGGDLTLSQKLAGDVLLDTAMTVRVGVTTVTVAVVVAVAVAVSTQLVRG